MWIIAFNLLLFLLNDSIVDVLCFVKNLKMYIVHKVGANFSMFTHAVKLRLL